MIIESPRVLFNGRLGYIVPPPPTIPPAIAAMVDTDAFYYSAKVRASVLTSLDNSGPQAENGDPVGWVADGTGNGYHQSAASSGARAEYVISGDTYGIKFDGVSALLQHTGSFPLSAPFTDVICVSRGDNSGNGVFIGTVNSQSNANDYARQSGYISSRGSSATRFASNSKAQVDAVPAIVGEFAHGATPHLITATCAIDPGNLIVAFEGGTASTATVASNWTAGELAASTVIALAPFNATVSANMILWARFRINRVLSAGELSTVHEEFRSISGMATP